MTWHSDNLEVPEGRCTHGLIWAVCRLCPPDPMGWDADDAPYLRSLVGASFAHRDASRTSADPLQLDWDAEPSRVQCGCWRCLGTPEDATLHMSSERVIPDVTCCDLACYEDPGCRCDGCGGSEPDRPPLLLGALVACLLPALAIGVLIGWLLWGTGR